MIASGVFALREELEAQGSDLRSLPEIHQANKSPPLYLRALLRPQPATLCPQAQQACDGWSPAPGLRDRLTTRFLPDVCAAAAPGGSARLSRLPQHFVIELLRPPVRSAAREGGSHAPGGSYARSPPLQFLDGFYMSRIGIRMLIGQHVSLHQARHVSLRHLPPPPGPDAERPPRAALPPHRTRLPRCSAGAAPPERPRTRTRCLRGAAGR